LAILRESFRSLTKLVLPLAVLFILSACGGATRTKENATRTVHGRGFQFSIPSGWRTSSAQGAVVARSGRAAVSVRTFTLVKRYDPTRFAAAAAELDGIAAKLAAASGTTLAAKETIRVAGRKVRDYRFDSTRIAFFLSGRTEYQLLCKLAADGSDPDGACALLFASFTAR
jgi:hypothetical protein